MAGIQYGTSYDVLIGPVLLNEHPYTPINDYDAADFLNCNLYLGADDAEAITLNDTEDADGWIRPYGGNGMYRLRLAGTHFDDEEDVGKSLAVRIGATDAIPTGTLFQYEIIDGTGAEIIDAIAKLSNSEIGLFADLKAIAGSETAATILGAIADLSSSVVGLKADVAAIATAVQQSIADKANAVSLVPDDPDNPTQFTVERHSDDGTIATLAITRDTEGRISGLNEA